MLEVRNISFGYSEDLVIKSIDFKIFAGQNISIIGESGCGKSTLLKLIYGLYNLHSGHIYFNGEPVLGPNYNLVPGVPEIKYLSQDFDLMPYITVAENVGKFLSNLDLEKKQKRISELLQMIEMEEFANTPARFLSGGQQQRVALARVLALEPQLLLLDEPFSQIDGFRRNAFRRNLFSYLKKKEISCIVSTHDSVDALSYADEVMVMKNGKILVKQNPIQLYQNPPNKYVASLFGEVNEVWITDLIPSEKSEQKILFYPHELKKDDSSDFKVVVKKSFFKGGIYLIQAYSNRNIIFFEHPSYISENEKVGLKAPLEVVYKRMM
jgi:ABC-type Fe3+/spermidine/putrescine transport system ATPase subunit